MRKLRQAGPIVTHSPFAMYCRYQQTREELLCQEGPGESGLAMLEGMQQPPISKVPSWQLLHEASGLQCRQRAMEGQQAPLISTQKDQQETEDGRVSCPPAALPASHPFSPRVKPSLQTLQVLSAAQTAHPGSTSEHHWQESPPLLMARKAWGLQTVQIDADMQDAQVASQGEH